MKTEQNLRESLNWTYDKRCIRYIQKTKIQGGKKILRKKEWECEKRRRKDTCRKLERENARIEELGKNLDLWEQKNNCHLLAATKTVARGKYILFLLTVYWSLRVIMRSIWKRTSEMLEDTNVEDLANIKTPNIKRALTDVISCENILTSIRINNGSASFKKTCKNYTFERPCQIGKANSLSMGFKIQFHSDTVIINGLSNKAQNKNRAKSFILWDWYWWPKFFR